MSNTEDLDAARNVQDREFVGWRCAELIREILRSISSDDDTGLNAAMRMEALLYDTAMLRDGSGWHHIFNDALVQIRSNLSDANSENDLLSAGKRGIKFFAESAAEDPAAHGRAARRRSEFVDSCRWALQK